MRKSAVFTLALFVVFVVIFLFFEATFYTEAVKPVAPQRVEKKEDAAMSYALGKLPEREAARFKGLELDNLTKKLIDLYASLPEDERNSEEVSNLVSQIISDGRVSELEVELFYDKFVSPSKPNISIRYTPTRVINDKVYDIRVEVEADDNETPIVLAKLLFVPVKYDYFTAMYGMRPEDYWVAFPNINDNRTFILRYTENNSSNHVKFTVDIVNITGGGEYKIIAAARDMAGNEGVCEIKTQYIRQFENIGRILYEKGIVVATYYYPWYSPARHWREGYVERPLLGEYDSRDPVVISKHIDWATGHGVNTFIVSWWGPHSWEDETLRNYILRNGLINDIKIAILYESAGRLDLNEDISSQRNSQKLVEDLRYIAENYFTHQSYLKISNRPPVVLYLAREYKGEKDAIQLLRKTLRESYGVDVYLIGDVVYWHDPVRSGLIDKARLYDAITSYNMHTSVKKILVDFEDLLREKYDEWWGAAKDLNLSFIPSVIPGFNDTAVRKGNLPLQKAPGRLEAQLEIISKSLTGEGLKFFGVTSFNEFHENTQIEPDAGHGFTYLNALKNFTSSKLQSFKQLGPDSMIMLIGDLDENGPNPHVEASLRRRIDLAAKVGIDTVIICFRTSSVEATFDHLDQLINYAGTRGIGVIPRIIVDSKSFAERIRGNPKITDWNLPDFTNASQLAYGLELLQRTVSHLEGFQT